LGALQKIEKEEEYSDIECREESGCSKSETLIDGQAVVTERIERTAEDLGRAHNKGQDGISMR
jgi:hypothetical protein